MSVSENLDQKRTSRRQWVIWCLELLLLGGIPAMMLWTTKARRPKGGGQEVIAPELSVSLQKSINYLWRADNRPSNPITFIRFNDDALTDDATEEVATIRSITGIGCSSQHLGDQGLLRLSKLPALDSFSSDRSNITDAGFTVLGTVKGLSFLSVPHSNFGDEALRALDGHPKLTTLNLEGCPVTDVGLGHVRCLPSLEVLALDKTAVGQISPAFGDFGFKSLPAFKKLKTLSLSDTRISEDSLAELPKCAALESLGLSNVDLTPLGCQYLAQCPRITHLWLASKSIDGAHLKELARAPALTHLHIMQSTINQDDLAELKRIKTLKVCIIVSDLIPRDIITATLRELLPGVAVVETR